MENVTLTLKQFNLLRTELNKRDEEVDLQVYCSKSIDSGDCDKHKDCGSCALDYLARTNIINIKG